MNYPFLMIVAAGLAGVAAAAFRRQEETAPEGADKNEICPDSAETEENGQAENTDKREKAPPLQTGSEAVSAPENDVPPGKAVKKRGKLLVPKRAVIAAMCICEVALAAFLGCVYPENSVIFDLKVLMLTTLLWPCAWFDFTELRIPNKILLAGCVGRAALLVAELLTAREGLQDTLISETVAAAVLVLATLLCRLVVPKSVGFGDMKLLALMGLFLGTDGIWATMLFSMLIAFVAAVALLIAKRVKKKDALPFAPSLLCGSVLAAFLAGV